MSAKLISAFQCAGKTDYYKNWSQYSPENVWRSRNNGEQVYNNIGNPCGDRIIDLDARYFRYVLDENQEPTKELNSSFPINYIEKIKEIIDEHDVIFISSEKSVRELLKEEDISYHLIYPSINMKEDFLYRFDENNYSEKDIEFLNKNWDYIIHELDSDNATKTILTNSYINYDRISVTVMNGIMDYAEEV